MKHQARIALPPLATLSLTSVVPYVVLDRQGKLLTSGEQPLQALAHTLPVKRVHAILHPSDAVVATTVIPPLPARRMNAAVEARVEPLTLSDTQDLCIAHGPRAPDGRTQVAWVDKHHLLDAWRTLKSAGLELDKLVPQELALPAGDPDPSRPLALPADARWCAPLPQLSLAQPEWRPVDRTQHWRSPVGWAAAALLLWIIGLQWHAAQLRGYVREAELANEAILRSAFPSIPVIIDPLRQASNQLAVLRSERGVDAPDDFMPTALAAARVLGFAAGHVSTLDYADGRLTLHLAPGYQPPTDETALQRTAAAEGWTLEKDAGSTNIWHIERAALPASGVQP